MHGVVLRGHPASAGLSVLGHLLVAVDGDLPFGNVAWRVEVGESFAAAMACGLVGFMVSRGSSMLIEGIEELKEMNRKWEGAICIVCGIDGGPAAGLRQFHVEGIGRHQPHFGV